MRLRGWVASSWRRPAGRSVQTFCLASVLLFAIWLGWSVDHVRGQCTRSHPVVGLIADLRMMQHQLRGTIEIVDDCTFKVDGFDMLPGKDVYWWGSQSDTLEDMLAGWPVSQEPLEGTFNGQSLEVRLENTTWDNIGILAVWSKATASNYGHIELKDRADNANSTGSDGEGYGGEDGYDGEGSGGEGSGQEPPSGGGIDGGGKSPIAEAPGPSAAPFWPPPSSALGPSAALAPHTQLQPGPPPPPVVAEKYGRWQPTMFENCLQLSHRYRLRWTVDLANGTVDIGLEAAVDPTQYLGFGWAATDEGEDYMTEADLTIAGYNEEEEPFAEDYFVTSRMECNWDSKEPAGVCPDSFLGGDNPELNNVRLIWGQHIDGITLIRFRRPLLSPDTEYDHPLNVSEQRSVIWALGPLRPPDSKNPHMTPTNHGMSQGASYGVAVLKLGSSVDDCQSVLTPKTPDLGLVMVADRGSEFKVTVGDSLHYPSPPSPGRSLYVNGQEAPVLKVERGVPVQFSVQSGHDLPVYITSDPIGGGLNPNETVYAGGPDAHGVPAVPYSLTWTPNSTTPDSVYYQAYTQAKMGWQVQVVDGGLSDMYTNFAVLADEKVTLFWTLSGAEVSFAVRGERPSGYLSLGFGSGMVNSFAYVGWLEDGVGRVGSYYIDSREAGGVHNWTDEVRLTKCTAQDGMLTFEFSRPLKPANCSTRCNVIDPLEPLKVVWAAGTTWTSGELSNANMHSSMSSKATVINLSTGMAEVEKLQPVFAVHGFMMFLSWGILMPAGALAARYLRHQDWFRIHVYTQCAGISVMVLGLLFAVGELQGFDFSSTHSRIGIMAIAIGLWQPLNAYFRPPKASAGERPRLERVVWQWTHMLSGRVGLGVGAVTLLSGIVTLENKYGGDDYTVEGLAWGMLGWFLTLGLLVLYCERRQSPSVRWGEADGMDESATFPEWRNGHPVTELGVTEEEEATQDLLAASRASNHNRKSPARPPLRGSPLRGPVVGSLEVELEALPR